MMEKECKEKSLDVTGFTEISTQRKLLREHSKTTFSPFFSESNILEIKTIFNASCSIKCSIPVLWMLPQYFRTAQIVKLRCLL